MKKKFTAIIKKEGNWYVAHCAELEVVSQGKTIEEAQANLSDYFRQEINQSFRK